MPLITISAPATEPITAAEVKASARIDTTDFDGQIAIIIPGLRDYVENFLGRRLITQTVELVLDAFPDAEIDLRLPDVQSITSVTYIDGDGATQTLTGTDYSLDGSSSPCWLLPAYGTSWPATRDTVNALRVRYVVGYGAAAAVPAAIRNWMIVHAVQQLGSPDGFSARDIQPVPFVDRLLDAYRMYQVV